MSAGANVLFVLPDQLGARWLPIYGSPVVHAPHLDAFARHSTVFERAVSSAPVCTPYRGCLMTGRYPSQTGLLENGQELPPSAPSVAQHRNAARYATYYIGKWHLSGAPQENRWVPPAQRAGFQHFIGWESHHIDHYGGLIWADDPHSARPLPGHETDALTDIALEQLEQAAQADQPFFMMVAYQAPHPPCSPPPACQQHYQDCDLLAEPNTDPAAWYKRPEWQADYDVETFRRLYFGEITQIDAAFGRLLAQLEALGLEENTLVIFTSDHGEMAGAHSLFGKGVMYEEALQVPLLIRAPGQSVPRRTRTPAATVDFLPTLLDYAGCAPTAPGEGISLRPYIESHTEGRSADSERVVISEYRNFCASSARWKLFTAGRTLQNAALYDLRSDPFEGDNRLDDAGCAAVQAQLSAELADWCRRTMALCH